MINGYTTNKYKNLFAYILNHSSIDFDLTWRKKALNV